MATEPMMDDQPPAQPAPIQTAPASDVPRRRGRPPNVPQPIPLPTATTPSDLEPPTATVFREEDPRTRAARRAAELRDHRGSLDEGTDDFYIDARIIPDGWSYEWKRHTTLGAEDPGYQVSLARAGWEAVPAHRHPEMMPDNYKGGSITRKGMILMERPLEITNEAKALELRKARAQVNQKEAQLNGAPAGQFERDNKGAPMAKISKTYEAIPIPKE